MSEILEFMKLFEKLKITKIKLHENQIADKLARTVDKDSPFKLVFEEP